MAISKDWYNTEFEENETESKHRPPSVEYSFYTAVKTGDMETVIQILLRIWREPESFPETLSRI